VWQIWGLNKFKMGAVPMVTNLQKMLNSFQTSQMFAVMFPVTSTSSETREAKKESESVRQTLPQMPWK
jgi:hypothetical protein